MPTNIKEIARELATQDNLMTDQPIFLVQQLRKVYIIDDGDNYDWVDEDWNDVTDAKTIKELEAHLEEHGEPKDGYTQNHYAEAWEFVTACFTRKGCDEYLAANGHNLKSPRVYADGSYRNAEWQAVRNFLMAQLPKDANAPTL